MAWCVDHFAFQRADLEAFAIGATTAATYNLSGFVDWPVAALFVLGGLAGGLVGSRLAVVLAGYRQALGIVFASVITAIGLYVAVRGALVLAG